MQLKVYSRAEHPISRKNIDPDALKVLYRLYRAGHTAYLVGGGIRDMLLGRAPKDFDVATSARPSQIKKLFRRSCHLVGRRFRLAHVRFGSDKVIEVSTFRREPDGEAGDRENESAANDEGYICSDNTFGTPEQDALRRDFTINSMSYNIGDFSLNDYCDGVRDLRDRVIRTIGDPQVRFREDPVRMIRAIKFCSRLDFRMDISTWQGILDNSSAIANASTARVQEEVRRLLESHYALRSFEMLDDSGLLAEMIPEVYDYLNRAYEGKVSDDPDGELLWMLLEALDEGIDEISDKEERRNFAIQVLILPLALEAGLRRGEKGGEAVQNVISSMGLRLGICNRLRCNARQTYAMVARLLDGRPERNENAMFSKDAFSKAFKLYVMLAEAGLAPEREVLMWRDRWDEFRSRHRGSLEQESSKPSGKKRPKRRRGGGHRKTESKQETA